ncbi:hypothetical protein LUZ60_017171 [Juncus effusus]|nr:hypothetical protein LUZ60_017171 [Juncus effusus]
MGDSRAGPSSFNDDDDEEDYEEQNGGSSLFGFMFGNIDNAGDLDADYLDEDAKENLFALADKLGPSLTEIAFTKASTTRTDASEQDDYDEKAEDAVDYEDIDEQYDGPETKTETEFFTPTNLYSSNLNNNNNKVFDDDNYDEDYDEEEQTPAVNEIKGDNKGVQINLPDVLNERLQQKETSFDHEMPDVISPKPVDSETDFVEVKENDEKDKSEEKTRAPLPVLYCEDGIVILKFSEIFGVQVPPKKSKRDPHKKDLPRATIEISEIVEEDEETYLRTTIQNFPNKFLPKLTETESEDEFEEYSSDGGSQSAADPCHPAQPMKDDDISPSQIPFSSFSCPDIYPIDHENWEDQIIWGNSPQHSIEFSNREEVELEEGENGISENTDLGFMNRDYSQVERLSVEKNLLEKDDAMTRFKKLSFLNKELLDGSWLDDIIWDPSETLKPKPKLIFDLQDDQMIFEALDERESENLSQIRSHASALVMAKQPNKNSRVSVAYNSESQNGQLMKFNISNDDFYATRKSTAQAKSNVKKRVNGGLKVLHSIPALKLQTMKPRLSHKEMANFHRPRALWYPHFNQVVVKFQQNAINQGPMKVILMTLGGKGVKVQLNAEESLSSLKLKASKKLDFRPDENVKIYYNGKELEMDKSLADQDVRPNSVLYIVTTKINVWTKAQKLLGEDKPLRPPGAFRKKSDLSVKDGRVFLMEYCEERPLLLSNPGMGARLCTYYQKAGPSDQTASSLKSSSATAGLGSILGLDPTDRSPFLGEISPGKTQSCLETNMYRAPVFNHKAGHTDYLLVRNAKGGISIRKIDRLYVVGQQEPHMEVLQPGTKAVQTYLNDRMQAYVYREFRAREKPNSGAQPCISADELNSHFPGLTEAITRKRLHHCAIYRRGPNGRWFYVQRSDFRIPVEEELRRRMTPENVCCYESMQAGWYHLRRMGIQRLTHPVGLSAAMNQLPDEAIVLAAASHIERELQITPWALTSNFIASTNQDRENLERLEIVGVGDPSGRGLGFSYVRATPKAPLSSANAKKKVVSNKNMTVTGTDADLRRLSMEAAREILLRFGVAEEKIADMGRWHRIADIRKLSSAQASSGMQMDASALSKFARGERGQRMSFSQVQQQTKEKCQEIWDRQAQSLSSAPAQQEENADEDGANSDLDSFAGDLENLLDAEEGEEVDERSNEKGSCGGINMKMRRGASLSQTEEEIEDDVEEAVAIRRMLDEDGMDMKGKKKKPMRVQIFEAENSDHLANTPQLRTPAFSKEIVLRESKEAESSISARLLLKKSVGSSEDTPILPIKKKFPIIKDGQKIYKEKTPRGESIVCGACGQVGHMRTNKNCPKYGEDKEDQQHELPEPGTPNADVADQVQPKTKKLIPKLSSKPQSSEPEPSESGPEKSTKPLPVKFKFGLPEKSLERNLSINVVSDSETNIPTKINKLIISTNKTKQTEEFLSPRPSIKIRPPAEISETGPRKKIIIKQPKDYTDDPPRTKRIAELATPSSPPQTENWYEVSEEERYREEQQRLYEARAYEETKRREEMERRKLRKKKKRKHDFTGDDYLKDHRTVKKERSRIVAVGPGSSERGDRAAKRRTVVDFDQGGGSASLAKRRKGGEVELSNILERIVDSLKEHKSVSYLFLKPVTKKEAPDYFDIVERPMDLSSIKEKVRKMEYKSRDEFRHDVFQITYNAHLYNDGKNPGIPPLADQLLELCDYYLEQNVYELDEAEAGIEFD